MANTAQRFGLIALAIAKMVVLVISLGSVGFYVDKSTDLSLWNIGSGLKDMGFYGREEFFIFATTVGFFVAVFSMIMAITGLHEKTPLAAAMFMAHLFCALSVLVSASLLARLTAKYSEKSTPWCKALENSSSDARCYQLIIGVVCGFVSMVLFIGESIIYIVVLAEKIGISFVNMDNITS